MEDNINPDHYKKGGIETIEYQQAKMSKAEFYGYLKGLKSEKLTDKIDDCKKAIWYLEQMVKAHQTELKILEVKSKADNWIDDPLLDED